VSDCGGVYKASVKLDIPSFFVEQVLRDEPVPDHVLDRIERKVGPIRFIDHSSGFPNVGSLRKRDATLETKAESEITLQEFVRKCDGILAASLKLGVSTSTIEKILSGVPLSGPTIKKLLTAVKAAGCSIASAPANSPLSMQHSLFEMTRLPERATHERGVYPSTLRKLQEGLPISEVTRHKLGISSEEDTTVCTPDHARTNSTASLHNKLREIVKSDVDMFNLASNLDLTATSLRKIYDGKPVSKFLAGKVAAALRAPNIIDLVNKPSARIERLQNIFDLYKQVGTLEAVGEQVGLTRQRIRQLLVQGDRMGLFKYIPYEYPFVSKEKIIEDYKKTTSFSRVARLNNIPTTYLHKLLTAYSITQEELADFRVEGRRARCIEQYDYLVDAAGHHLTTTELQSTSKGHSLHNRINKLWGAIDAFREACNIPKPPQGSPTFRKDTERWRAHQQQIALVSRMQQLDQLREYLDSHGATSTAEIAVDCGLNYNRVLRLLGLLMRAGEVRKTGQGSVIKYILL
jgi:hypothetical protein